MKGNPPYNAWQFTAHYAAVIFAKAGTQSLERVSQGQEKKLLDFGLRGHHSQITKEAIFPYS